MNEGEIPIIIKTDWIKMRNSFKVSYVTTLPKEGNAPRLTITGNLQQKYLVNFLEVTNYGIDVTLISQGYCTNNQTIFAKTKQWFTNWRIEVYDESGALVYTTFFDPQDKAIYIKMDAYALGDTLAWIPYVENFRQEHQCKVICSTFHNNILTSEFPNILFVKPNTVIENLYAQYYIGASNDDNLYYSPIKVNQHPLQDAASSILGLRRIEQRPDLSYKVRHIPSKFDDDYVTLSEFGSAENKHWKVEGGWQGVVDFLNSKGYKVVVISKEKTSLTGVVDKSGDISLEDRMVDIFHAKMHLGVSSGLSWLAWSLGTHTVMISDVTPNFHEFQSNITRLNANQLTAVNYLAEGQTSLEEVLLKLGYLTVS